MIRRNLQSIREQLPEEVTLVAVSKTKPLDMIEEAYACGQRVFGENRPQELQAKAEQMPMDIQWHMIGHLQTKKVKYIIEHVALIHSIDSVKLLDEVEKRAATCGRIVDCLMQVHIAQESEKYGFTAEGIKAFFETLKKTDYPHVRLVGLMGMATFTDDADQVRSEFKELKKLHAELINLKFVNHQIFSEISMGMSGDYLTAVDEGSTMVRIGSSIFGTR